MPQSAPNATAPARYLCPYCGAIADQPRRCPACAGHLDPLSRQATQNSMGPWQVRDQAHPFRPGCSYATIRRMVERGQINRRTVLRGPTTRQFWTFADRAPSIANLLGVCHSCHAEVDPDAFLCGSCGASFTPETDRQYLGLAPRRPLPGEAPAERVAQIASGDPDETDAPRRTVRPAFPADPRPSAQATPPARRGPRVALVAIVGVFGLAIGAAAALVGAAAMGWIDLTAVEPQAALEPPVSDIRQPAPLTPAAEDAAPAAEGDPAGQGPEGPGEPGEPLAGEAPAPSETTPAEPQEGAAPADSGPAVPPKLRRLP
ncbi:MAG: hypothetical protein ACF8R7_13185 [Phycisphaerales bacterium JB039]